MLGKTPDVSLTSEARRILRDSWVPSEPLYKHLTAPLGLSGEKLTGNTPAQCTWFASAKPHGKTVLHAREFLEYDGSPPSSHIDLHALSSAQLQLINHLF